MKQYFLYILRILRLISLAEKINCYFVFFKNYKNVKLFKKNNPSIILPPWKISYDAYAGLNPENYMALGMSHAKRLNFLINKFLNKKTDNISICDWGCGPMRVLRHLSEIINIKHKLIGIDYNKDTIKWATENFKGIEFKHSHIYPPIPQNDNSVDVVYAISVFTHLSEKLTKLYINDLHRIIKKDGLLIITLHGEKNSANLLNFEFENFKKGFFVTRRNVTEGKRIFTSYHPINFVKKNFTKFKTLLHDTYNDNEDFEQEWWVFKK